MGQVITVQYWVGGVGFNCFKGLPSRVQIFCNLLKYCYFLLLSKILEKWIENTLHENGDNYPEFLPPSYFCIYK